MSERTSPAFEHKSDGASPDVAQKLLFTMPSGCSYFLEGAINSGFTSDTAFIKLTHNCCVRWL